MRDGEMTAPPAIYYLHPLLAGPLSTWNRHLERCRVMGFSHLLLAPPFAPGRSGDVFLTADFTALHPVLATGGAAKLSDITALCDSHGLSPWLDLVLDRVASDTALPGADPAWLRDGGDPLPDPRNPFPRSRAFDYAAEGPAILTWWQTQIRDWLDAGITGFRILRPEAVPSALLRDLIRSAKAHRPDCRFALWTPGLSPAAVAGLQGCGADYTFASTCWWDFREDWYFEEQERLARVAPPLAPVEAPFGTRLARRCASAAALDDSYRRLIRYAATSGPGWLMPMGFEYGAAFPLDPAHGEAAAFDRLAQDAPARFAAVIAAANAEAALLDGGVGTAGWQRLSAPGSPLLAELSRGGSLRRLRLVNTETTADLSFDPAALLARSGEAWTARDADTAPLHPAELRLLTVEAATAVTVPAPQSRRQATSAGKLPRLSIERIAPAVDGGRHPAKRVVGESITVTTDIFSDGHGVLAADLLWRARDETVWRRTRMAPLGNDRWSARFRPERIGDHTFTIEAWQDVFGSLQHGLAKKHEAGQPIALETDEAIALIEAQVPLDAAAAAALETLQNSIARAEAADRLSLLLAEETRTVLRDSATREGLLRHEPEIPLIVDRGKAAFSSWYELFPRSQSGTTARHGTFDDVIRRLPDIVEMGFDTLYFPPIHPIGRVNRKGRNNSPLSAEGDPGSPYAIGAVEGGHDAIHPELGTIDDFRRLREAAEAQGIEIALDFAIQCAPDHPWLKQHPEWFAWRPDGSIAYAENPPKKYEDIVNVDFYGRKAVPALWLALRDVVLYWRMEGVRTFRVDNPHTKPLPFWRWLIADIRARFPDTLFLSEAFTRPQMMYALAKAGFSQSYTYFTWRNTKAELEEYMTELTQGPPADFFRPHFFVNTPDINPFFLQRSGRAGFLIRAALAATLSGLWGLYSGFELCEATPLPGREEYLDSEKYEIKAWDWNRPGNIKREIAMLNRIRRDNPALHSHRGLTLQRAHNEQILFFAKQTPERDNVLLVAINLDPHHAQEAAIEIPLWQWGLPDHASVEAKDLVGGGRFQFRGKHQSVRLDPHQSPFAIWRIDIPADLTGCLA
jgi:starch synthase (maltosyl-transferring)